MSQGIQREIVIPQPRARVWEALTNRATLAEWMYPNDFEPRVGHRFTFEVPASPKVNFDGLTVRCEVLACEAPERLVFSWSAGGPVENTRVSFRLEDEGEGTRVLFEHTGFDVSVPFGEQALKGAGYGWANMLAQLARVATGPSAAVSTERVFSASARRVFAAFEQAEQLAAWWGPKDFTNTFEQFEFKPGGRWVFVMHGPNGADYANESVFQEIEPDTRIVIEHVGAPWFRLTVTLSARGEQTHLDWHQEFESPEVAASLRALSGTANEQVLDRLEALLASGSG